MKSVVCILALLCTAFALEQDVTDPSRTLERLVNLQKTATEAIHNGLVFFEERTTQNLKTKLNELKTEALVDIHNTINEALENVNLSIDKGKQEGKNVNECYSYARNNLETKNTNAIATLDTCIQNGHTAMEGPLANVANSIEAAKKLLNDLDAIIPNCYSTSFLKMQACVVKNLFLTRSTLKRVGANAREVTSTAGIIFAKTIIDARSCTTTNAADTRSFSTDIVIYTDNCVRNAPEGTPEPSSTAKTSSTATPSSSSAKPPSSTGKA
ncbi:PREDICTED: uncharacterized protein LOC105561160 [Vollenhovia emeryi]|uniref:uncharacterized protein LOC105561160 n=1 Tax=Vollenhovia emeryi TaxID=411798 RepID=UPI0005F380EC|nr:PREDICTED: uncharacterized protein LOC105561160 [Vollenhovia emeryi]